MIYQSILCCRNGLYTFPYTQKKPFHSRTIKIICIVMNHISTKTLICLMCQDDLRVCLFCFLVILIIANGESHY